MRALKPVEKWSFPQWLALTRRHCSSDTQHTVDYNGCSCACVCICVRGTISQHVHACKWIIVLRCASNPLSLCISLIIEYKSTRPYQTLQSSGWIVGNNIPIFSALLPNSHHTEMRLFITSLNWPVIRQIFAFSLKKKDPTAGYSEL